MKLQYPTGNLLQYVDRNSELVIITSGVIFSSPHSPTVRATYNVPTGKVLHICTAQAYIRRDTTATTVGEAGIVATINDLTQTQGIVGIRHTSNTLLGVTQTNAGCNLYLPSGTVRIITWDVSTGGAIEYCMTLVGYTFDVV